LVQSLSLITIETAEKEDLNELDITELFSLAAKGQIPRKVFIFGKIRYSSTPRLHFFNSTRIFSEHPLNNIPFRCKFCDTTLHACFPTFTGLSKHLMNHNEFNLKWLHFNEKSKKKAASLLDSNIYDLIRYIIS
jgi:hypothetical protein